MPKIQNFFSFMKFFAKDMKEEWDEMDHKLLKLAIGIAVFVISGLFWFYFFRATSPFGF